VWVAEEKVEPRDLEPDRSAHLLADGGWVGGWVQAHRGTCTGGLPTPHVMLWIIIADSNRHSLQHLLVPLHRQSVLFGSPHTCCAPYCDCLLRRPEPDTPTCVVQGAQGSCTPH
jgi:hypothetical protein